MEFRWVALIAVWTMLSGPVFNTPSNVVVRLARPSSPANLMHLAPAVRPLPLP